MRPCFGRRWLSPRGYKNEGLIVLITPCFHRVAAVTSCSPSIPPVPRAAGLTEPTWLSPWLQRPLRTVHVHAHVVMCAGSAGRCRKESCHWLEKAVGRAAYSPAGRFDGLRRTRPLCAVSSSSPGLRIQGPGLQNPRGHGLPCAAPPLPPLHEMIPRTLHHNVRLPRTMSLCGTIRVRVLECPPLGRPYSKFGVKNDNLVNRGSSRHEDALNVPPRRLVQRAAVSTRHG
jgi:hypothetical protein